MTVVVFGGGGICHGVPGSCLVFFFKVLALTFLPNFAIGELPIETVSL